jgi:hypothetical protein
MMHEKQGLAESPMSKTTFVGQALEREIGTGFRIPFALPTHMLPSRRKSISSTAGDRQYVALLSFLPLKAYRKIPAFIQFSNETQRQLQTTQGLIGYSLQAQILRRRFWTLLAWESEAALMNFVSQPPHAEIMNALAPHMSRISFVRWTVGGSERPLKWHEAKRRYYEQLNSHL